MKFIVVLMTLLVMLAACETDLQAPELIIPEESGSVEVYFCPDQDCETALIDVINAGNEVHCAFYDLELEKIKEALEVHQQNVLIDDDTFEGFGVSVRNPSGLMHHKFCVVDKTVVTGSFNPTFNGANKNYNNLIIIESGFLAENYLEEWAELSKGITTSSAPPVTYPLVKLNGELFENYFCPEDRCEEKLLNVLETAKSSIKFMTFSFTSDPVGRLIVDKIGSGVLVTGIFEKQQSSKYSEYSKLLENGADVLVDKQSGKIHHKVFIIDDEVVVTGSYNPSSSGTKKNSENMLIIHDSEIVSWYLEEFAKIMEENR